MTPSAIIDLLGGTKAVAEMCQCSGLNVVSNWRRERIPSEHFGKLVRGSKGQLDYEDLENQAPPKPKAKQRRRAA